ncbi:MAG: DUF6807 family protein [Bryobacteraceae bacterium]
MMLCLLLMLPAFAFRDTGHQSLLIEDRGKPVYEYNYGMVLKPGFPAEMSRSGYLHPVYAPDGTLLTDDFNPDHAHHRGISWMWQVVKVDGQSYDLWTVKGIKSKFVKWIAREAKSKTARLEVENGWFVGDRKVVVEKANIVAHAVEGNRRRLDFELTFEAVSSPVEITGTPDGKKGFGGFCMRFAPRDGGKAETVITTENGKPEKDGVNEPHRWAAVSGTFQGKAAGARIDDSPSNPGYPNNGWLLRHGFGFLNPYFPGLNSYTIQPGKPLKLRYTVTLFTGAEVPK